MHLIYISIYEEGLINNDIFFVNDIYNNNIVLGEKNGDPKKSCKI